MKSILSISFLIFISLSCSDTTVEHNRVTNPPIAPDPLSLQSLHVRLTVRESDGGVSYFGWYDGQRNLLGNGGIGQALVGMEPPDLKGEVRKIAENEIVYEGVDQNQIVWLKRYRLEESTVHVTIKITSKREQRFNAIIYSLSDLPDSTITGTPRDQIINSPVAGARFHADIDTDYFKGESMSPFILRSDEKRLAPGGSMEFHMTWELDLPHRN